MLSIADVDDMEDSNTTLQCPSKPGVVVGVGSVAEIDWSIMFTRHPALKQYHPQSNYQKIVLDVSEG